MKTFFDAVPKHLGKQLWLVLTLSVRATSSQSNYEPYTVATLAGGGGSNIVEQAGTVARLSSPAGVAADSAGNVYVADTFNNSIRKMTPEGRGNILAGRPGTAASQDGTGTNSFFNYPDKLTVDSAGNVFVADSGNNTLRKITPEGVVTTLAGRVGVFGSADGVNDGARFSHLEGVAVDGAGNIYVLDSDSCTIRKVAPVGTNWVVTTLAGSAGSVGSANGTGKAARFNFPQGLAIDVQGNLYVGDTDNYTVRKVTPAGVVSTIAGRAGSPGTVDGTNNVVRLGTPKGVAVDSTGNVYVADDSYHVIRKITPSGTNWIVTTLAGSARNSGSADGPGSAARFLYPYDVAVDPLGNVYVATYL